jgi:putative oxidoreductase
MNMKYAIWLYTKLIFAGALVAPIFLLALRLWLGYQLAETGWGHLTHLDKVTSFFESLNIPMPHANAVISGVTELAAGVLWMLGLGTRLISWPTFFNFCVAYWMASREAVTNILSKPDDFIKDDAFPFLLLSLILISFGPGLLSLDALLKKLFFKKYAVHVTTEIEMPSRA